jgi:hypothetical protein
VSDSASFERAEADWIVADVERHIGQEGVTSVRFDGPPLQARHVSMWMTYLIGRLAGLVEGRGLRFFLGPLYASLAWRLS